MPNFNVDDPFAAQMNVMQRADGFALAEAVARMQIEHGRPVNLPDAIKARVAAREQDFVAIQEENPAWIPEPPPLPPNVAAVERALELEKIVVIEDVRVKVPAWTNYVAQRKDGSVVAYENRPQIAGHIVFAPAGRIEVVLKAPVYEVFMVEV